MMAKVLATTKQNLPHHDISRRISTDPISSKQSTPHLSTTGLKHISSLPDKLSPVERDDSITKCFGDHALMAVACSQYVTTAAESAKIADLVRAVLAALNVINVRFR